MVCRCLMKLRWNFGEKMLFRWVLFTAPMERNDSTQVCCLAFLEIRSFLVRTLSSGDRLNYFSLAIDFVKAVRAQKEPQVVYVGNADQAIPTQAEATEGSESSTKTRGPWDGLYTRPKTSAEAVLRSGVAFTMLRVKGLNEHPQGKFPVVLHQAPLERPHLSFDTQNVGSISRGDVAALLVSAMSEPNCVNAEIMAGEPAGDSVGEVEGTVITNTLQEDVKSYLKQLEPNK
eukprot:symbB.v1.2.003917.t1/scaffold210.1/size302740/8